MITMIVIMHLMSTQLGMNNDYTVVSLGQAVEEFNLYE
ncbi:hypothetical protein RAMDARK_1114 [Rickettsia amblyommatis str. Darkwater]|nr:hypothetical protein RAMDARK_1114 [Rickettsia amblyommatis str. Darkwater]